MAQLLLLTLTKEQSAVKEAVLMGIPVIGIVDTNSDPSLVDFVIPANDDSPQSISLLLGYLADAVARGKEAAAKNAKAAGDAQVTKKGVKERCG